VLAGCGRIGFGALPIDAATDAGECPAPPATGVVEPNLIGGFVRGLWLSPDALSIVFTTDTSGGGRTTMLAHRPALDMPFATATAIPDFASLATTRVAFSDDELDAVMSLYDDTVLYETTRTSTAQTWPAPTPVAFASPVGYHDELAWLSPDGLVMYFDRAGATVYDQNIYTTSRAHRGDAWSLPTMVAELSSPTTASFHPSLDAAQTTIWFARELESGTPAIKVFRATRADPSSSWSAPAPMLLRGEPLNQADPEPSRDDCELVFASPPGETDGQWAVWSW